MNLFKVLVVFSIYLGSQLCLYAQQSDSVQNTLRKQLNEVEIITPRLSSFSAGNKTETIDSTTLSRYSNYNLADLLSNESQIFVKSYGLGSSATTSFRGAGASHTAVLWNGFNIQSPMLAQLDFSLVPVTFIDNVKLQYGSAGALWGSGAVGGTIHLNNKPAFNRGFTTSKNVSYGSFGDVQGQLLLEVSKKNWSSSLKLFHHSAKNDFPFINTAQYGQPEQKQTNANLHQRGLLQENYFIINSRQSLNERVWYQYSNRDIPPSMTQNISKANQKDRFLRTTAEWQRKGTRIDLFIRGAYFDELLLYKDPTINENSKSHSKTIISEAESKFSVTKKDLANIGINNTYYEATTPDYQNTKSQNRIALFVNYKIQLPAPSWHLSINARQELVNGKTVPYTITGGLEGNLTKIFIFKANVSKHYRLPSFNDLYWAGVGAKGNPNLLAENGWCEEASLIHNYFYKKLDWELGATAFNRTINHWIIWIPDPNYLWTPQNVLQVWSRGIEYKLTTTYSVNKFKIRLSGMYNYILSTNEKSAVPTDNSLHKQLIYVPIQNAQGSIMLCYKKFSIAYIQVYTGYRYTTTDNKHYLSPYTIGNINVSQLIHWKKLQVKFFAQINNIWNERYQVIEYRAMPLLNYQIGVTLTLSAKTLKAIL